MRRWIAPALGLSAGAAIAGTVYGVVAPDAQLFGPVITAPGRPGQLALTFDDGPNSTATPTLLDRLAEYNVRATFFLIGRWALDQPALARRIATEGHGLGCHTMTHPRLPLCSRARIRQEIADGMAAVEDVTGVPVPLFRPPHGFRTPFVLRVARELGMSTTTWTTIGNDWKLPAAEAIARRVERGVRASWIAGSAANVVLHDGGQGSPKENRRPSVIATGLLLQRLSEARFVTLQEWI